MARSQHQTTSHLICLHPSRVVAIMRERSSSADVGSLAPGEPPRRSAATMKKGPASGKPTDDADDADDLLPEYHFDYRKAKPNRFAPRIEDGSLIVVLDPDIAQVFTTP